MAVKGHIVGIREANGTKVYSVLLSQYNPNTSPNWKFSFENVPEQNLMAAMKAGKVALYNAKVEGGALVGTTGALSRFNPKDPIPNTPVVVLSEIRVDDTSDRLIGYRIATGNGQVKAIRLNDMLSFCMRITKAAKQRDSKAVPIQNCMYVADSVQKKGTIRAYVEGQLIVERVKINKPNNAAPAKVDTEGNKRQITRLEEMFSKEQIRELKLGKQHGVNIRVYGNNKLSADQMKSLRKALESGVDARAFADPRFTSESMQAYSVNAKYGVDISSFINPEYNPAQIYELSTAWLEGIDISKMADPKMSAEDMSKLRIELEMQLFGDNVVDVVDIINRYGDKN